MARDSAPIPERLWIGVSGTVDPSHAPVPANDAERFVFRQLYETLVRVDCAGQPSPGLAQSWQPTDSGERWSFTLRAGARFSDGTPVTAGAVIDSWTARAVAPLSGVELNEESERVLQVRLPQAISTPAVFADPALAVTRLGTGREWPPGTGPYAADTSGGRVTVAPYGGTNRPVLGLRASATGDARDLLDAGIDVLITDDPAVQGYAQGRSDVTTVALPWDRIYVLAVPGEAIPVAAAVRAGLARDAVRIDARTVAGAPWWSDVNPASCGWEAPSGAPPPGVGQPSQALVFPRDDAIARDLVGRLVALGIGGGGAPRATGLGATEFNAALAAGDAAGYVFSLPLVALEPCAAGRAVIARAPWLVDGPARHLTPLVQVRRRAILRRGAAAFTVDWDGTLRVR